MNRLRDPQWFLLVAFLAILGGVPLIQTLKELREEEAVRALELFDQAPTSAGLRSYERRLEQANWVGQVTRPWVQYAQFAWLRDGGSKVTIGREGWYFYKPGLNYLIDGPQTSTAGSASSGVMVTSSDPVGAIVDYRDQLAARGIRLLLLPVPNKESIYPDRVTERAGSMRQADAPRTREIFARLRSAKVEVVDLFEEFRSYRSGASGVEQVPLYLAQDTHWSPAGVERAARLVARRLTELGWAQKGRVEYEVRSTAVRRTGDLIRMLQSPAIERAVRAEEVVCQQVIRKDAGELYRDGAEAEVLVLGDSFTRIYQQDAPMSAGFSAHLARELNHPVMSLVNDGGGSTLGRQELRANPAMLEGRKVVIWEFVERDIGLGLHGWQRVALP